MAYIQLNAVCKMPRERERNNVSNFKIFRKFVLPALISFFVCNTLDLYSILLCVRVFP